MTALAPLCEGCLHYSREPDGSALECTAYPAGIPAAILESRVDHREPYAGDDGIVYEPDPAHPLSTEYIALLFLLSR